MDKNSPPITKPQQKLQPKCPFPSASPSPWYPYSVLLLPLWLLCLCASPLWPDASFQIPCWSGMSKGVPTRIWLWYIPYVDINHLQSRWHNSNVVVYGGLYLHHNSFHCAIYFDPSTLTSVFVGNLPVAGSFTHTHWSRTPTSDQGHLGPHLRPKIGPTAFPKSHGWLSKFW